MNAAVKNATVIPKMVAGSSVENVHIL